MKILLSNVGLLDAPNAAFLRTYYFARELARKGHNVTLLTTQREGYKFPFKKIYRDNLLLIAVPSLLPLKVRKFGYGIISLIVRVIYVLMNNYDIVHSDNHRPASSFPALIHSKLRNSKYIAEWWDYFGKTGQYDSKALFWKLTIGSFDNFLEKKTIKSSDGAVVLSILLKKRALELKDNNELIEIVWGGSDTKEIGFYPMTNAFRSNFNLPIDKYVFISTGMGATEILEYSPFFEALNILADRRNDFVFARTGSPVPEYIRKKLKLGDYFYELGFVDYSDYQKVLASADMFVLIQTDNNKNNGRWPNCIGDYLAAGRPIMFNAVGDLVDFKALCKIGSQEVNIDSIELLADLINEMLNKKRDTKVQFETIRQFAESDFSWTNRATQLEGFYKKIIAINEK